MNKETWNGLPQELQKLIENTSNEISASELARRTNDEKSLWSTYGQKVEVYKINKEEEIRWRKATASVADKYAKDMEAKGYPAREALELMRKVNAKER
jgi:TRAP-type C4-dicarboxylate transport system substrate-binding protein